MLALGGIENARTLLLSERRTGRPLGNERGLVGRYFMEHPHIEPAEFLPLDPARDMRFYTAHKRPGRQFTGTLVLPPRVLAKEKLLQARLMGRLTAARRDLDQTLRPVREVYGRLSALGTALDRLDGQPVSRVVRLRDDIAANRHALFMLGVLDDQGVPPLSLEPANLQAAYDEMMAACQNAREQLGWIQGAFAHLQREIKTRSKSPEALDSEITALHEDAGALVAAWCDPWVDQLERVEQMLDVPPAQLDAKQRARIDRLSREATSIRNDLARRIAAGDDFEELRLRFSDLARETLASRDG